MARASAVDYADVSAICTRLFLAGKSIGLPGVYAELGKGSTRVVQGYIERWRRETADKLQVTLQHDLPGVPEAVATGAQDLVLKVWQGALAQADETLQLARHELEQERMAVEAERERNAASLSALEGDLKAARATLDARDQELGELKGAVQDKEVHLREAGAESAAYREQLASLSATLEAVQHQHATDLAAAVTRGEEILAEARRQHTTEIEREREQSAGERSHLMGVTDQLRQQARTTEAQLREEIAGLRAMADGHRNAANRARDDANRWQGRAEQAEELLAKLTTKKRKPAAAEGAQA